MLIRLVPPVRRPCKDCYSKHDRSIEDSVETYILMHKGFGICQLPAIPQVTNDAGRLIQFAKKTLCCEEYF